MTRLVTWVADGTVIVWILWLVAFEAVFLIAYRSFTRRGPRAAAILSLLLPGVCLLLALRCALTHAGAIWVAALLLAAFVAHLADVALRWRASAPTARHGRWTAP